MSRNFDGVDDSLSIDSAVVTAEPLTVSGWMWPDDFTDDCCVFYLGDKDTNNARHVLTAAITTGLVRARTVADDGTAAQATTAVAAATTGWNHVCGVWAASNDRRVYLNGANKATNATSKSATGLDRTAIGREMRASPQDPMDGKIGEVAVWSVALSDGEVAALARGVSPLQIRAASLVMYVPAWGTSSPERDYTAGQRHLTVTGATADIHPPVASYLPGVASWLPVTSVVNVTISPSIATSSAAANAPTPTIIISPAIATADAAANAPTPVIAISPAIAQADAAANAPTPQITVSPAIAEATAAANAPTPVIVISPTIATADAAGVAPTIVVSDTIAPPIAEATAAANAPTITVVDGAPVTVLPRLEMGGGMPPGPQAPVVIDVTAEAGIAVARAGAFAPTVVIEETELEDDVLLDAARILFGVGA